MKTIVHYGLASNTLCREEGCGHTATFDLSPWQNIDVTNQICALHSLHLYHGVQLHHNTLSGCRHLII